VGNTPKNGLFGGKTMNEMVNFEKNGLKMRVVFQDGLESFVLKDACDALGLDAPDAARQLRERFEKAGLDAKGMVFTHTLSTPGGDQEMLCVSEQGLYEIIFSSTKPEAIRFRAWVTGEVLPSIRKTGKYELPEEAYRSMCKAIENKAGSMVIRPGVADTAAVVKFMGEWSDHMLNQVEMRTARAEITARVLRSRMYDLAIKYGTTPEKRTEATKLTRDADDRIEQLIKEWEAVWQKRKKHNDSRTGS
jgi:prophage antirepressor-like protein